MIKRHRKKRAKPLLTLEEWCEDLASKTALNIYELFEDQAAIVGPDNHRHLFSVFLAGIISATVYRSLAICPANLKSDEERCRYAEDSFTDMKNRIQEAVAAGFTGGMKSWSGESLDYYCQVKVMPEAANKENPC